MSSATSRPTSATPGLFSSQVELVLINFGPARPTLPGAVSIKSWHCWLRCQIGAVSTRLGPVPGVRPASEDATAPATTDPWPDPTPKSREPVAR